MRAQADELDGTIATMERAYALMQQLVGSTHHMSASRTKRWISPRRCAIISLISTTSSGPIRNYFYSEPHCYNIPVCWAVQVRDLSALGWGRQDHRKAGRTRAGSGQCGRGHAAAARAVAAADRQP